MQFFLIFFDDNLDLINTFSDNIQNAIVNYEHKSNTIKSEKDFLDTKQSLNELIVNISRLKIKNIRTLNFLGGLTLIYHNMFYGNNKAYCIDIIGNKTLVPRS